MKGSWLRQYKRFAADFTHRAGNEARRIAQVRGEVMGDEVMGGEVMGLARSRQGNHFTGKRSGPFGAGIICDDLLFGCGR
jgi:hypothetical protein